MRPERELEWAGLPHRCGRIELSACSPASRRDRLPRAYHGPSPPHDQRTPACSMHSPTACRASWQSLRGHGKLSEAEDIDAAMREIRLALLEADVNFKVVREFVAHVKERALGAEVMESLTPAQQVVKIVNEELVALMGAATPGSPSAASRRPSSSWPACRARARRPPAPSWRKLLKKDGKRPVLIAADVYRPAAIDQLADAGRARRRARATRPAPTSTRSTSRATAWPSRATTATWPSSTPPAACTSTRS